MPSRCGEARRSQMSPMKSFAQAEIRRLQELRLTAIESRIEANFRLECTRRCSANSNPRSRRTPLGERLAGQLMVALYRCDRQAMRSTFSAAPARTSPRSSVSNPGLTLTELQSRILRTTRCSTAGWARTGTDPPKRASPIIGRKAELDEVVALLEEHRRPKLAVTLTGAGRGSDKTRLAEEVAWRIVDGFRDGAAFVDLVRSAARSSCLLPSPKRSNSAARWRRGNASPTTCRGSDRCWCSTTSSTS